MADAELASVESPGRRRESWSLKTIVENVAGRPITDFQDPSRPVHPYIAAKLGHSPVPSSVAREAPHPRTAARATAETTEEPDPVDRVYPPLTGATGRGLHGSEHEHHAATLHALGGPVETSPGDRPHTPGPSRRPERIYLHYLLLHVDRLSDHALAYLKRAVDEELTHRERGARADSTAPPPP